MSSLRRLARLTWREWGLLGETLVALAQARVLVRLLPFRVLAKRLGTHMAETTTADCPARQDWLSTVTWAVTALSRRLPWRCQCLEQALAAQTLLRRRNLPHTLYLGARLREGRLEAHAWVRCGGYLVTGHTGEEFPVVSCFAQEGSRA